MSQVQISISGMMPELIDLKKKRIFSSIEIQQIVKQRTSYEYALLRRPKPLLSDFMRYIAYEIKVEMLRRQRRRGRTFARLQRMGVSDLSIMRRIFSLFARALLVFPNNLNLWFAYIEWAMTMKEHKKLMYIIPRALRFHPLSSQLWLKAAMYEYEISGDINNARMYFQRGLRLNQKSVDLWLAFFHMEVSYIGRLSKRKVLTGIIPNVTQQEQYITFLGSIQQQAALSEQQHSNVHNEEEQQMLLSELLHKQSLLQWTPEKVKGQLSHADRLLLSGAVARTIYDNACKAFAQPNKVVSETSQLIDDVNDFGLTIDQKLSFLQLLTSWRYGIEEDGLGKERRYGGDFQTSTHQHKIALRKVLVNEKCLALVDIDIYSLYQHIINDIFVSLHTDLIRKPIQHKHVAAFWDSFARLSLICQDLNIDFPVDVLQEQQVLAFLKNNELNHNNDDTDVGEIHSIKQQMEYQQQYKPVNLQFPTFPAVLPQYEQNVIVRFFLGIKMYSAFPLYMSNIPAIVAKLFHYLLERINFYFTTAANFVNKDLKDKNVVLDVNNYDLCSLLTIGYKMVEFSETLFSWVHTFHYEQQEAHNNIKVPWLNSSILIHWLTLKTTIIRDMMIYTPSTPPEVTTTTVLPSFISSYDPFMESQKVSATQEYKTKSLYDVLSESLFYIKSYLNHLQHNNGQLYTLTSDLCLQKTFVSKKSTHAVISYDPHMEQLISILYSTYINFIIRPYTSNNVMCLIDSSYKNNISSVYMTLLELHTLVLTVYNNCITKSNVTILPFSYSAITLLWDSFTELHTYLIFKLEQQIPLSTTKRHNFNVLGNLDDSTDNESDSSSDDHPNDTLLTLPKVLTTKYTLNHYEYNTWFTSFIQNALKNSKFFHQQLFSANIMTTMSTNNALELCIFLQIASLSYYYNIKQYYMVSGRNVFIPMTMDFDSQYINIIDSINVSLDTVKSQGINLCSSYLSASSLTRQFIDITSSSFTSVQTTTNTNITKLDTPLLRKQYNYTTEQLSIVLPTIYKAITTFTSPAYSPHNVQTYTAALTALINLYKQVLLVNTQHSTTIMQMQQHPKFEAKILSEIRAFTRQLFTRASRDIGADHVELWVIYLDFLHFLQKQLSNGNTTMVLKSEPASTHLDKNETSLALIQELSDVQQTAVKTLRYHLRSVFVDLMNSLQQTAE